MFKHHNSSPKSPDSFPRPSSCDCGFYAQISAGLDADHDLVWRRTIREIELETGLSRPAIATFLDSHYGSLFALAVLAEAEHRLWDAAIVCTIRSWRRHAVGNDSVKLDMPSTLPYLDALIGSIEQQAA